MVGQRLNTGPPASAPEKGPGPIEMKKVLVVDGTANGRELLRTLLEHEGYEVFEASDSPEAVERAQTILPDLILLDVYLPTAGAYAAVRQMRTNEYLKDRVIIALPDGARRIDRDGLI